MLKYNLFRWWKSRILSIIAPVLISGLQCHMIFRNHSNMLICFSRNISYYYKCFAIIINSSAAYYFFLKSNKSIYWPKLLNSSVYYKLPVWEAVCKYLPTLTCTDLCVWWIWVTVWDDDMPSFSYCLRTLARPPGREQTSASSMTWWRKRQRQRDRPCWKSC